MNNQAVRYSIAAAVVVVLALLGAKFLPPSNIAGPGSPTPMPTQTSRPTPVPRLDAQGSLEPGRYQVNVALRYPTVATVAVPAGWQNDPGTDSDWIVFGPRGKYAPDGMGVRLFAGAVTVFGSDVEERLVVGPTVDDLVQAIVNLPAFTASAPMDVTIDGHTGQLVQLTIRSDAGAAWNNPAYLFQVTGGQIYGDSPGQTFDLYIIDVDGQRLVINAYHYVGTSEEDLAAQRAVVESVQIRPAP